MAKQTADDDVLAGVGPRLRALRQQRGVSLSELSATTGVSVSTLSRLESGQRRPTLELLLPLAKAHGVTLDELVDAPPTGDPRIHLRPVKGLIEVVVHVPQFARSATMFAVMSTGPHASGEEVVT